MKYLTSISNSRVYRRFSLLSDSIPFHPKSDFSLPYVGHKGAERSGRSVGQQGQIQGRNGLLLPQRDRPGPRGGTGLVPGERGVKGESPMCKQHR